jgi:hypothetical protein
MPFSWYFDFTTINAYLKNPFALKLPGGKAVKIQNRGFTQGGLDYNKKAPKGVSLNKDDSIEKGPGGYRQLK